jgi:hypothetical protein
MNHSALRLTMAGLIVIGLLSLEALPRGQERGQISGWGSADGKPVRNATARLRDLNSGELAASTTCDRSGIFAFVGVPAGTYAVELVCAGGAVLGASAPVTLGPSRMAANGVSVDINELTARAAGASACLGPVSKTAALFDLARRPFVSALGLTVVSAAAASGVTAIVATNPDTSGSR